MSITFSIKDAEARLAESALPTYLKHVVKQSRWSMGSLSRLIGESRNYLSRQIKNGEPSLSLLYTLTVHLKINMFEYVMNQLPENLRATQREKKLEEDIASLQKQLADMTKERDIYKEILIKR